MSEIKTVEISGQKYHIGQVSALLQFKIMVKLAKAGAAPFLSALATTDNLSVIGSTVIASIFERLEEEAIEDLAKVMLSTVRLDGESDPVSVESYQGNMGLYMRILMEALKVNYSDFTQFLTPLMAEEGAQTGTKTETQSLKP